MTDEVEVVTNWMAPTPEFPRGSHRTTIGSKVVSASGRYGEVGPQYFHGGPPFNVIVDLPRLK